MDINNIKKIFQERIGWKGAAIGAVLIIGVVAMVADQVNQKKEADRPANQEVVAYKNEERGFSFNYPKRADLAAEVREPQQLALLVLPEGYADAAGKPANYMIEIVSGTVSGYRLYSKEMSSTKGAITLSLIGPQSKEIPSSVKESLGIVRDSFKLGR